MPKRCLFQLLFMFCLAASQTTEAASLRISPVNIELSAKAPARTVRIRNEGTAPVTVQMRVFQWTQADGKDTLQPTRDVVVSPPITKLIPKRDYVVRVIRIARHPVKFEENFRLLVDEIPEKVNRKSGTVSFVIRQSLPVRYQSDEIRDGDLVWHARKSRGAIEVIAENTGSRRMKITGLTVLAHGDRRILEHKGLSGYVLGSSKKSWKVPVKASQYETGQTLQITGETASGKINSHATLHAHN